MGKVRKPLAVKLFFGMLSPEVALFEICKEQASKRYGPIDYQTPLLPWDKTDYYRDEMGSPIFRTFFFFERLIEPGELATIKVMTNEMEDHFKLSDNAGIRRRINIDPGYVTEAKVVLATTKDFSHRIYIGSGIYAEVTLRYSLQERSFMSCDYTYPDYRTKTYLNVFNEARELLRKGLGKAEK